MMNKKTKTSTWRLIGETFLTPIINLQIQQSKGSLNRDGKFPQAVVYSLGISFSDDNSFHSMKHSL